MRSNTPTTRRKDLNSTVDKMRVDYFNRKERAKERTSIHVHGVCSVPYSLSTVYVVPVLKGRTFRSEETPLQVGFTLAPSLLQSMIKTKSDNNEVKRKHLYHIHLGR
jgi:hypothetical protein